MSNTRTSDKLEAAIEQIRGLQGNTYAVTRGGPRSEAIDTVINALTKERRSRDKLGDVVQSHYNYSKELYGELMLERDAHAALKIADAKQVLVLQDHHSGITRRDAVSVLDELCRLFGLEVRSIYAAGEPEPELERVSAARKLLVSS